MIEARLLITHCDAITIFVKSQIKITYICSTPYFIEGTLSTQRFVHFRSGVNAVSGTIASICASRAIMDDDAEHNTTKRLLVKHVWDRHGEK